MRRSRWRSATGSKSTPMKLTHFITVCFRKIRTLHRVGLLKMMIIRSHILFLECLRAMYKFDRWHSTNPFPSRPYKKALVDIVNELKPSVAVDVGCGLGDVLTRISAKERYGIDPDRGVIRAARLLHPKGVQWVCGDSTVLLNELGNLNMDCLIMIGWIHGVSPETLASIMQPLIPRIRYCILDAFNSDKLPYPYKHDFEFLKDLMTCVSVVTPVTDSIRRLIVYKSSFSS
jgi:ubiquinone/menaquinone biosynthesis C-methylase UbiE